jgi:hypothetical protein
MTPAWATLDQAARLVERHDHLVVVRLGRLPAESRRPPPHERGVSEGAGWFPAGIPGAFHILELCLTHFRGQCSAFMPFMAPVMGTPADAWAAMTAELGLGGERRPRDAAVAGVDSGLLPDAGRS